MHYLVYRLKKEQLNENKLIDTEIESDYGTNWKCEEVNS